MATTSESQPQSTMRAVVYRNFGNTSNLTLVDNHPIPKLTSPKSVLVKVHATSVNALDWKMLEGYLSMIQFSRIFPFIPCFDISGVVVEVGKGCQRFEPGDQVWALSSSAICGGCAEYIVLPEKYVSKKPKNLSHTEAASLPRVGLTSYRALVHTALLKKDQKILILGGGTATGSFAIQLAKHIGASVATTCSERNVKLVQDLGADKIIDYNKQQWFEVLKGANYDVVYDCVGGIDSWVHAREVLRTAGIYVTIVGDQQTPFSIGSTLSTSSSIVNRRFWALFGEPWYYFVTATPSWTDLYEIRKLVEAGAIRPVIDKVYSMEKVAKAFERSKAKKAHGKLVIRIVEEDEDGEERDHSLDNSKKGKERQ
jgi:alcohol dehydrogenase